MVILRVVFWLAVVAMLLPTAPGTSSDNGAAMAASAPAAETFGAGKAIDIAASTGSDVLGFCDRNPAVCDTAASAGMHLVNQVIYYTGEALSLATQALIDARTAPVPATPPAQGV